MSTIRISLSQTLQHATALRERAHVARQFLQWAKDRMALRSAQLIKDELDPRIVIGGMEIRPNWHWKKEPTRIYAFFFFPCGWEGEVIMTSDTTMKESIFRPTEQAYECALRYLTCP